MSILKNVKYTWWQLGLLKFGVLFAGIAIGAYGANIFASNALGIFILGLVLSIYPWMVWYKQ